VFVKHGRVDSFEGCLPGVFKHVAPHFLL